uniref:J domain-containing protein n=1 Tax=Arundo donax TaxID=35708 RepID=A0A0A9DS80_ARUDO
MSWGRFNPHQGATRQGMRRSSAQKPSPCTVVVIDEDDDGDDASDSEVFIIDGAAGEAAPSAAGCQAKKGNGSSGGVISIDDDEDEEKVEEEGTGRGDKAGPSASRAEESPAATTPGRGSPRNRYGLDCTSDSSESDSSEGWDSESSDGGTSDCEILDDTSGTARKMWETAASRKKMPNGVHESREGSSTASTSSAGSETTPDENAYGLFGTEYNLDENIFFWYFSNAWKEDAQNGTGCSKNGTAECHLNENMQFSDAWKEGVQNSSGDAKDGHGSSSVPNANEHSNGKETDCRGSSEEKEFVQNSNGAEKDGHGSSSVPNANEHSNGKETDCRGSSNLDPGMACNDKAAHSHDDVVPEKAPDGIHCPHLDKTFVSANRVFPSSSSAVRKDGSPPMFVSTPEKVDEKISGGVCSQKDQSPPDAQNVINKDTYAAQDDGSASGQQKAVPPFTSTCDCSRQFRENCSQVQANSCACAAASIKNTSVNVTSGSCSLHRKDLVDLGRFTLVQDTSDFQYGLIGEREKHKESVEFKRAAEKEWASRQRQLQIQADEAKKLRKRKKAEALRLLDMEKRQKQRLQEVRESQRKNEEEIQLKEQYRGAVRKELEDTERRYRDMASILRALGIPVQGGEVKAAFKQALLKFHPDRVSRNDVYQQVKAEETFKFISRLKEKLPRFV